MVANPRGETRLPVGRCLGWVPQQCQAFGAEVEEEGRVVQPSVARDALRVTTDLQITDGVI